MELANIDCEIFQVCLDEAMNSYQHKLVWEVQNNNEEDLEYIVDCISKYVELWPKSWGLSIDEILQLSE